MDAGMKAKAIEDVDKDFAAMAGSILNHFESVSVARLARAHEPAKRHDIDATIG